MKDVSDRVSELLKLRSFSSKSYQVTSECVVEEESDMYGFSLISQGNAASNGERQSSSSTKGILYNLMKDQNWNNPGNVCLMCRAYQIDETYQSVVFGQTLGTSGSTYLVLKSQQHIMFSDRYYSEGVACKSRGLWSESIKSLSDALVYNANHLNARVERADSYFRQNKKAEAFNDYKQILIAQPHHAVALERVMVLRNNTSFTPPGTMSAPTDLHNSNNSRIQLTDRSNVDYVSNVPHDASTSLLSLQIPTVNKNIHAKPLVYKNTGLIDKLQQALLDNPKYFDTSSSGSSEDDSGSSSESSDSDTRSDKKSSKKRKRDERNRSKKEHKTSKKRKHKKDKRSKDSKRKKKHKSEK